jgi:hypothetical protein
VNRIWKFKILGPDNQFDGPAGARAVTAVIEPDGQPVLYLFCPDDSPKVKMSVSLFATTQPIPESAGDYVATLRIPTPEVDRRGTFVMHVFFRQVPIALAS